MKRKIQQSKSRINSVRFGVPFEHVCPDVLQMYEDTELEKKSNKPKVNGQGKLKGKYFIILLVDYSSLEIDTDRRVYFTNLLYRYQQQQQQSLQQRQKVNLKPKTAWAEKYTPIIDSF